MPNYPSTRPVAEPTITGRHAFGTIFDLSDSLAAPFVRMADAVEWTNNYRGTHRRVILDKPVNLVKRSTPNADTLVRSFPNAGPWDHCETTAYCKVDCPPFLDEKDVPSGW